ncbi:hypothetical protein CSC43_4782 [Pseudomonas aeruginosa]|nr:hypothetical protein CSC43_4782 [Pseudomonas aeruginosa]
MRSARPRSPARPFDDTCNAREPSCGRNQPWRRQASSNAAPARRRGAACVRSSRGRRRRTADGGGGPPPGRSPTRPARPRRSRSGAASCPPARSSRHPASVRTHRPRVRRPGGRSRSAPRATPTACRGSAAGCAAAAAGPGRRWPALPPPVPLRARPGDRSDCARAPPGSARRPRPAVPGGRWRRTARRPPAAPARWPGGRCHPSVPRSSARGRDRRAAPPAN